MTDHRTPFQDVPPDDFPPEELALLRQPGVRVIHGARPGEVIEVPRRSLLGRALGANIGPGFPMPRIDP